MSESESNSITLPRLNDMHVHLRRGKLLELVARQTARYADHAVVMPNTRPGAILNSDDVIQYRSEIMAALTGYHYEFQPLMTIEIRDDTTPETITAAKNVGAIAGKVYPLGVTTNSDEGLRDFFSQQISETFRAMQDVGMLLLIHGELDHQRTLVTKREEVFLPTLLRLAEKFPNLKIVMEHVSTEKAVRTIEQLGKNVAATITAHHLRLTLNDVIGDGIQPHNGCMPIPKDFSDRDALVEAAISGNPKFFLGSDSAPHLRKNKECSRGACGVYTAPILPELLVEIFEAVNCLDRLENFTSLFGANFYGISSGTGTITLKRQEWVVPNEIDGIVPFGAGKALGWKMI